FASAARPAGGVPASCPLSVSDAAPDGGDLAGGRPARAERLAAAERVVRPGLEVTEVARQVPPYPGPTIPHLNFDGWRRAAGTAPTATPTTSPTSTPRAGDRTAAAGPRR